MEALGSIGDFFSSGAGASLLKLAEVGMSGAGTVGNLLNNKARSDELSYVKQQQKALADPTTLAKEVSAATQPLNQGLIQGVENTVGSNLAEQGLSQAPGIQASVLAQALAPFQQQNQQTALQLVLQRLGLPLSYASTYLSGLPQNSNIAPLLALLQKPVPGGAQPANNFSNPGAALPPYVPPAQTNDTSNPPDIFSLISQPQPSYADNAGGLF